MKTRSILLAAFLGLFFCANAFADDVPIPVESLPQAAKAFVKTHFPGNTILYAEMDWNSYECRLDDGTKIEFNKKGVWKKVDRKMAPLPAEIVPDPISGYVKTNFGGAVITKIDKKPYGYEIELSNDMDLMFNTQGIFIGYDD